MQDLSFERQLDVNMIATMINVRVQSARPGFIGRFVRPNEINEFAVRNIKRDFNDKDKRQAVLQHVYQSIIGGF